jgi:hypothetical protein
MSKNTLSKIAKNNLVEVGIIHHFGQKCNKSRRQMS